MPDGQKRKVALPLCSQQPPTQIPKGGTDQLLRTPLDCGRREIADAIINYLEQNPGVAFIAQDFSAHLTIRVEVVGTCTGPGSNAHNVTVDLDISIDANGAGKAQFPK